MPITPACQPRSASTKAASSAASNCSLICLPAANWMLRSRVCRVALSWSMYWASSRARSGRSVTSSSTASCGWPSRPAAFSRAPRRRRCLRSAAAACPSLCRLASTPATRISVATPSVGHFGQAFQAVMHQHAILIDQGHHVGHRPQGGQPHGLEREVSHPRADLLRPAGLLAQRPGQLEGHARAAQLAEGIGAARQPRMNDRRGLGERGPGLVMIGDDQFQAELAGQGGLLDAGDAAIDRHQQVRLAVAPGADGVGVQPVALLDAVRHVVGRLGAEHLQAQPEDGRAGHAVDVVIAVDDDPLAGGHGVADPPHGLRAAGQELRIAQRRELRLKEVPRAVRDR